MPENLGFLNRNFRNSKPYFTIQIHCLFDLLPTKLHISSTSDFKDQMSNLLVSILD